MTLEFDLEKEPQPETQETGVVLWEKNFLAFKHETLTLNTAITLLETKLYGVKIKNLESHEVISDIWQAAHTLLGDLDEKRKLTQKEQFEYCKKVNDLARPAADRLEAIKKLANAKAEQYKKQLKQDQQDRQKKAREERDRLQAALDKEAKEKGLEGVIVPEVVIEEQKKITTTKGITTYDQVVRKWELEDIEKVPKKYIIVNEKMVNGLVKSGIDEIPGIRIWEETKTRMRGGRK